MRLEYLRNMVLTRGYYGQFQEPISVRRNMYTSIDQLRLTVSAERLKNLQHIESLYRENRYSHPTKIVFVTFNHTFAKINMLRLNESRYFRCRNLCKDNNHLLNIPGITVSPAPEP